MPVHEFTICITLESIHMDTGTQTGCPSLIIKATIYYNDRSGDANYKLHLPLHSLSFNMLLMLYIKIL